MDTDKSASVSPREFDGFGIRVIQAADIDADGTMTRDELIRAITGEDPSAASSLAGGKNN
jgi:hypothetical protein